MKQIIRFNSQVLIYEFDPVKNPSQIIKADKKRKPLKDFKHTWYRREEGLTELAKINLTTFQTNDLKSIHYGWLYWDSGHELNHPNTDMITCYLTKPDNRLVVTDSTEKPKQPLWWGISLLFALIIEGKKNLLKAERFAHRNSKVERTMLGQKKDGTLILATSKGLTAEEAYHVMNELGCYTAAMCDGGGSAQMEVNGKHYGGSRPLGTVLAVMGKEPRQEVASMRVNDIQVSKHFKMYEYECKDGSHQCVIHPELRDRTQALRDELNRGLSLFSAYRNPTHNKSVGGSPNSQHLYGKAIDVHSRPHGLTVDQLAELGKKVGFRCILKYSWGCHFDVRDEVLYHDFR